MTRLLVSVRNAAEARLAFAGGAHLIDVKEPSRGALGAADAATIRAVTAVVDGRVPVSAALGELADPLSLERCRDLPPCQFAKLGLAGMGSTLDWRQRWAEALELLPAGVAPVAVAYADADAANAPPIEAILETGVRLGCAAFLIDTWHKSTGSLVDYRDSLQLTALALATRSAGLLFVVAGALRRSHLPQLLRVKPDYIGVRGAVCEGGREGHLAEALVRRLATDLTVLPIERPFAELVGTGE